MALVQPSYGGGSALLDHAPSTPMTSSPGGGSKLAQMQVPPLPLFPSYTPLLQLNPFAYLVGHNPPLRNS
uniref:Uncharacterized protein n=1 Tax=Timema shepardi TaxID=629360 RepID=A0A7R9AN95_TIMSH|nr:unnamed protein product [Timema shepardi]